jgi:hypothetical protein
VHALTIGNQRFSVDVFDNGTLDSPRFNGLGNFVINRTPSPWPSLAWNFEHIFDGVQRDHKADPRWARVYEPRQPEAVMALHADGPLAATLYQPPTPHWGLESLTRFSIRENGVDIEFSATLRKASPQTSWFGLFWATYPEAERAPLLFPGRTAAGEPLRWIRGDSLYQLTRNTWTRPGFQDVLQFAADYDDKLYTARAIGVETFDVPLAYGVRDSTAFAYFLDGELDLRVTQTPLSAWDAQYVVHGWEVGACYGLRARIVLKPFVSVADLLSEYEQWSGVAVGPIGAEVPSQQ